MYRQFGVLGRQVQDANLAWVYRGRLFVLGSIANGASPMVEWRVSVSLGVPW